jgi:hypothetical protein
MSRTGSYTGSAPTRYAPSRQRINGPIVDFLLVTYALVLSWLPLDDSYTIGQSGRIAPIASYSSAYSVDASAGLEAFGFLRLSAGIETLMLRNPYAAGMAFSPFQSNYRASASVFYRGLEVGIAHECDHPVMSGWLQGAYGKTETRLFISFKGSFRP